MIQTSGLELLTSGRAHALAGNTQVLVELAPKIPGAIVVEASIYRTPQALAVVKGRPAGASYAKEFIEHVKASGLLEQSIEGANLRGVTVAPPGDTK